MTGSGGFFLYCRDHHPYLLNLPAQHFADMKSSLRFPILYILSATSALAYSLAIYVLNGVNGIEEDLDE
jgi:hypothetical protein